MSKKLFLYLAIFIFAAFLAGVFFSRSQKITLQRPNILLISIDTLRADRLSSYGYLRNTTPFLDSLTNSSARFEFAISVSPWTLPSHVSMLTGLYPSTHGLVLSEKALSRIPKSLSYLPRLLKKNGYITIGLTGGGYVSQAYGFDSGFDIFKGFHRFSKNRKSDLAVSIPAAERKLEELDPAKPFFLFLHTYDVHCPYGAPDKPINEFRTENAEPIATNLCGNKAYQDLNITEKQAQFLSDRYDEAISYVDQQLKNFFEFLSSKDLLDNTLVIITADHGEEFLEHGRVGHQESLYRELIAIPLILKFKGIKPGVIKNPVSLVDIAPTILQAAGIAVPTELQGYSLFNFLEETSQKPRKFIYSELDRGIKLRSHIDLQGHLIHALESESNDEFYTYPDDLREKSDKAKSETTQIQKRLDELKEFQNTLPSGKPEENKTQPSEEHLKQLETLGYL